MIQALSPAREAIKMAQLWRAVHGLTFPINAGALAQEWSRNVAPEAPIGELQARELKGFEGGLFWLKERKVWALLYHPHPDLPGRSNVTVAHEFGHYVLHRLVVVAFQCSQSATLGITGARIEREADQFASYLLMPIDDYTQQVRGRRITLDLLGECADRYGVSLTAAILKWLEFTDQAAVVVMGREGMLHWWKASGSAKNHETFNATGNPSKRRPPAQSPIHSRRPRPLSHCLRRKKSHGRKRPPISKSWREWMRRPNAPPTRRSRYVPRPASARAKLPRTEPTRCNVQ